MKTPTEQRPQFPTYLLPSFSLPFRRRHSSTTSEPAEYTVPTLSSSPTSSAATTPSSSPPNPHFIPISPIAKSLKGLLHAALQNEPKPKPEKDRLSTAQPNTLKCGACATDIAFASQIVSKGFTGRHGRAFLVAPPPREYSPSAEKKNPSPKSKELINTRIGKSVNRELLTGAHVVADVSCVICGTVLGWKYVDAKEPGQRYKIGKFILETKRVVVEVSWEDGVAVEEEQEAVNEPEGREDNDVIVFDSEDEDECEDLFAGVWDPELVAKRRAKRVNTRKKD